MAVGSPSGAMRKLWNQTAGRHWGCAGCPRTALENGAFSGIRISPKKKIGKDLGLAQQRNVTADYL